MSKQLNYIVFGFRSLNKLVESLDDLNNAVRDLKTGGSIAPKSVTLQSPKQKGKERINKE